MAIKEDNIPRAKIQDYLDAAIIKWHNINRHAKSTEQRNINVAYIDAFQSVRETLLGEKLSMK